MSDTLLSDLPRGDPARIPPDPNPLAFKPPSAAFARPADLVKGATYQPGRIFLGTVGGVMQFQDDPRERHVLRGHPIGLEDNRHMVTIAGSRAGKGRSVIVPNMLLYPGSVLATDPKGELATITARQRHKGLRQNVHVLDPFGTVQGNAVPLRRSFNPVMSMRRSAIAADGSFISDAPSLIEGASLIADALVMVSARDAHWDESARTFIEGVILHVCTSEDFEDSARSLLMVYKLIAQGALVSAESRSMTALKEAMDSNPAAKGVIQDAAADFFQRPEKERDSVLSTARRHLKFLAYPEIQNVLQGHDFELGELKTKATTIYLCLPARHIGTCSRWLRLFINLTLQSMEQQRRRAITGLPVLMVLDEFASLGHMRQIEDAAGQIAGFGVRLWPVLQDLGQLKALYANRWETFMGNAGVLQFFGNNDLTTLEWISKRCGKTSFETLRTASTTSMQQRVGASGESRSGEVHDLLAVDEAARYFNRDDWKHRQLILSATRPIVLQRIYYDKHEKFAGLWDEVPE